MVKWEDVGRARIGQMKDLTGATEINRGEPASG